MPDDAGADPVKSATRVRGCFGCLKRKVRVAALCEEIGGARRDRTADLLRARQALSQLSYGPNLSSRDPIIRMRSTNVSVFRQCNEAAAQLSVIWWVWVDLNHRPHPYQGCALTN